jgi:hypothetical protein
LHMFHSSLFVSNQGLRNKSVSPLDHTILQDQGDDLAEQLEALLDRAAGILACSSVRSSSRSGKKRPDLLCVRTCMFLGKNGFIA